MPDCGRRSEQWEWRSVTHNSQSEHGVWCEWMLWADEVVE
jgi:hypothetical protein